MAAILRGYGYLIITLCQWIKQRYEKFAPGPVNWKLPGDLMRCTKLTIAKSGYACPMKSKPGISRNDRISDEGLRRLERQLASGAKMSPIVLEQWVKRYGEAAEKLIQKYSR